MRLAALVLAGAGCGFSAKATPDSGAVPDMAVVPDAGPCTAASMSCASETLLRSCSGTGAPLVETTCPWGCLDAPAAHCAVMQPAGNVIAAADLSGSGLGPAMLANTTIDGSDGTITGVRAAGAGVKNGIFFELRPTGSVFRFSKLELSGTVRLKGDRPIVLVASGDVLIHGVVDGRGDPVCGAEGRTPGPGGGIGGDKESTAPGPGGGAGTANNNEGGGGGGHGGPGGAGGAAAAGGAAFGTPTIDVLAGGGGGGGGGGAANAGFGGGGGAAIQIVAGTQIEIDSGGGINAGGCGGDEGGGGGDGGGGGGAGGTILLEAPAINILGALAVNGGGGGTHGDRGKDGTLSRMPAAGGTPTTATEGSGGAGAAGSVTAGNPAQGGTWGAGGGAIGRIRLNTRTGTAAINASAVLSPAIGDATTATEGRVRVQ